MNVGKKFERNFKKSVPNDIFFYRFKDGSSAWGGNDKVRFQSSNIADCELFDGTRLYLLELKSTKGKSLPFTNIRENQLKELSLATYYQNIVSGLVIEFSDLDRCFFMNISDITDFIRIGSRKSIPIDYCADKGIEIEIKKKRVNNSFNIKKMILDISTEETQFIS